MFYIVRMKKRTLLCGFLILLQGFYTPALAGNGGSRDGGFHGGLFNYLGVGAAYYVDPDLNYKRGLAYEESCDKHFIKKAEHFTYRSDDEYKREFVNFGMIGLERLRSKLGSRKILNSKTFIKKRLKKTDLKKVEEILVSLEAGKIEFKVDAKLEDLESGHRLTAQNQNTGGYKIWFNPRAWEALDIQFLAKFSGELKQAIVIHEIMGLLKIEWSNFYPFSSLLAEELSRAIEKSQVIADDDIQSMLGLHELFKIEAALRSFPDITPFKIEFGSEGYKALKSAYEKVSKSCGDQNGYFEWSYFFQLFKFACGDRANSYCFQMTSNIMFYQEGMLQRSHESVLRNFDEFKKTAAKAGLPPLTIEQVTQRYEGKRKFRRTIRNVFAKIRRLQIELLGLYRLESCEVTQTTFARGKVTGNILCKKNGVEKVSVKIRLKNRRGVWQRKLTWLKREI